MSVRLHSWGAAASVSARPQRLGTLSTAALTRATDAFLAYPIMADSTGCQAVIALLSPSCSAVMPRSPVSRVDVFGILRTLAHFGPEALTELFEALTSHDDNAGRARELYEVLEGLRAVQT